MYCAYVYECASFLEMNVALMQINFRAMATKRTTKFYYSLTPSF